ncbi:MAG: archease [Candidatus Nanohaloarchaea archaeon]
MGYEILEHTADAKFRATGKTLEEAFESTVRGFAEIVGDGETGQVRHTVDVKSESLEALLFDFMDRLIVLQDTEGVVVRDAENLKIEDTGKGHQLTADILTDRIDPGGHYQDIKGPTYNEMKVEHGDSTESGDSARSSESNDSTSHEWIIEVVLDI